MMKTLPIDTVPVWCPTWEEIKGKARHYKTAKIRSTGEYVRICRLASWSATEQIFVVTQSNKEGEQFFLTEQLCNFCL